MIELTEQKVFDYENKDKLNHINERQNKASDILLFLGFNITNLTEECKVDFMYKGHEFTLDYDFNREGLSIIDLASIYKGICLVNLKRPYGIMGNDFIPVNTIKELIVALNMVCNTYENREKRKQKVQKQIENNLFWKFIHKITRFGNWVY